MSKKHYSRNSDGASVKITAIIALFLALIVGAYVVLSLVYKTWNPVKWTQSGQEQTDNDGNGEDKDPSDDKLVNSGENKGIFLRASRISSEQYEDYGIDEQANTAYNITATVNEDAGDKSVVGSVSWKDNASSWATGKNIADYVTLNQTVQYGLEFTLTVNQPFGEPVMIKVASCADGGIYGTAQVDHLKELELFTATLNPSYGSDLGRVNVGDRMNTVEITPKFGVGTIQGTISNYKTTFTTNAYFRSELQEKLNVGLGTSGYHPVQKITTTGKDFKIPLMGLIVGGGNSQGASIIVNNFIVERGQNYGGGLGNVSSASANYIAGVSRIEYEITYSYGDEYSVVKTRRYENTDEMFSDNPTKLYIAFRSDCLTIIKSITDINLVPDNIIVYPD